MSANNIEEKVKAIIARKLGRDAASFGGESRLAEDLGVDSFGAVELMFEIEEGFGLKIADSEIEHIRTVADIVRYLQGWLERAPVA